MTSTSTDSTAPTASGPREPVRDTSHLLLLGGPAYAVLLVVAAAGFPAPPHGDVAAATQPAWLGHHVGAAIAQDFVRAAAALSFVILGLGVAALCRRRQLPALAIPAAVGGALVGAFMLAAQAAALGSAHLVGDGAGADAVRSLGFLQEALLDVSSLPAVLLFAATALLVFRTDLPQWLGVVSLLGVPLAVVDALSYEGGPLAAVGLVGLVFFLAWSVLAGVRLLRA